MFALSIKIFEAQPVSLTQSAIAAEPQETHIAYVQATREIPVKIIPKPSNSPVIARKVSNQDNVALGKELALKAGHSETQWQCLYTLGMRESGWNHLAKNKSSGAYGIPQSLPASKLDTFGNRHDPTVQILWFLSYVKSRYGNPCIALQHSFSHNWY